MQIVLCDWLCDHTCGCAGEGMQLREEAVINVDCCFSFAFAFALTFCSELVVGIVTFALALAFVIVLCIVIAVFKPITHLLERFLDFVINCLIICIGFVPVHRRWLRAADEVPVTVYVMAWVPVLEYCIEYIWDWNSMFTEIIIITFITTTVITHDAMRRRCYAAVNTSNQDHTRGCGSLVTPGSEACCCSAATLAGRRLTLEQEA